MTLKLDIKDGDGKSDDFDIKVDDIFLEKEKKIFFDGPSNKFFQSSSSFRNVEKQFVECQIYLPNAEPCNKRHSDHGADDLNNF